MANISIALIDIILSAITGWTLIGDEAVTYVVLYFK